VFVLGISPSSNGILIIKVGIPDGSEMNRRAIRYCALRNGMRRDVRMAGITHVPPFLFVWGRHVAVSMLLLVWECIYIFVRLVVASAGDVTCLVAVVRGEGMGRCGMWQQNHRHCHDCTRFPGVLRQRSLVQHSILKTYQEENIFKNASTGTRRHVDCLYCFCVHG
jgi:hypothetical protein